MREKEIQRYVDCSKRENWEWMSCSPVMFFSPDADPPNGYSVLFSSQRPVVTSSMIITVPDDDDQRIPLKMTSLFSGYISSRNREVLPSSDDYDVNHFLYPGEKDTSWWSWMKSKKRGDGEDSLLPYWMTGFNRKNSSSATVDTTLEENYVRDDDS